MLTHEQLVRLYQDLSDQDVLSTYLDGQARDPAERTAWRRRLEHQLAEERRTMEANGASADKREALEAAWGKLKGRLSGYDSFLPGRGWVGFATADEVHYADDVPVPMPDLVRFEKGIRVAPYVRGFKQERVVVTALVDSRRARVFRYQYGELTELLDLVAETFLGDLTDINIAKRATTSKSQASFAGEAGSSGVRGKTATDAAQRFLEVGSERMVKQLVDLLDEAAGEKGFVVLGGTQEGATAVLHEVPRAMRHRLLHVPSLHVALSAPEVKAAAEDAASTLTRRHQAALLQEVVDMARAGGKGCLGLDETDKALRERRVETLLMSRRFIRDDRDLADHCVGAAFEQHAEVEELSDGEAERLDEEGRGIGARLRYRMKEGEGDGASGE